jgi:GNAT superfamily N-acetyltransferase
VALGTRFIDETAYAGRFAANPAQMARLAEQLLTAEHGAILVAERDGILVGMIGMIAFNHHISGEWMAGEVFWWVNDEARGVTGIRLLKRLEAWARAQGAAALQMGAPVSSPRVAALYRRIGFTEVETTFQLRLT